MPVQTESGNPLSNFPFDLGILLFLPVFLVVISLIFNLAREAWLVAFGASMSMAILGAMILCYAKWPLYRASRFWEFGAKAIPDQRKRAYQWAWRLIAVGVFFSVWLAAFGNLRFNVGLL